MAERDSSPSPPRLQPPPPPSWLSPDPSDSDPNHPTRAQAELQLANFGPGTYIVQVPKDQVYRVPPPENSQLAEIRRNPNRKDAKRTRCICLTVFFIIIAVGVFIVGLLGGLFSRLHKAKDPRFTIQRFGFKNNTRNPVYNLTLLVYNADSKVNILYQDRGRVSLSLGQKEIGSGPYPSFRQEHGNTTVLGIALKGTRKELPKEKGKVASPVKLDLEIGAPTKLKMGALQSGTLTYNVICQLKVDKLAETSRVISQQCQAERH